MVENILRIIAMLGSCSLGACAVLSPSAPGDLKFVSTSVVDTNTLSAQEQGDIGRNKFNSLPRKVLEVKFSSNDNLVEDRKGWNDTYIWTVACRDWKNHNQLVQNSSGGYVPAGPLDMGTSSVYWNDVDIIQMYEKRGPEGTGPFTYHFYIDISKKSEYQPHASYDLRANAEDVCFQITSAEMVRPGAKTNIVTIPKVAIASALKNKT